MTTTVNASVSGGGGGELVDGAYGSITVSDDGASLDITDGVYGDITVSGSGATWTYTGGSTYLGPMSWAALQASSYANGSPGLAALDLDASVFVTDWRAVMTPSADKTYWTSSTPIILDRFGSPALGNDIVYTATGTTSSAVASASAGAKTRVTITGHGLTAANDGVSVYVSAGTNWAAGFYPYTYVDANNIDLSIAWNPAFGNPAIRSATGSLLQTVLKSVALPAGLMQNTSMLEFSSMWLVTNSANNRYCTINLGSQPLLQTTPTSQQGLFDRREVHNRGAKNSQSVRLLTVAGYNTASMQSLSQDTATALSIDFCGDMRVANEFTRIVGYSIQVFV